MNELKDKFTFQDKDGNRIYANDNGELFFYPANQIPPKPLQIGMIYALPDGRLVYVKYEDERHIFRKTNSWSVNYEILKRVTFIKYITRNFAYWIEAERAKNCGEFFHFKVSGVETKIYIPVNFWIKRKRQTKKTA